MKIRFVEAELFHVDGRTGGWTDGRMDGRKDGRTGGWTDGGMDGQAGITKLIVALRNFLNAPKDDFLVTYDENEISVFIGMRLIVFILVLSLCSHY